MRLAIKILIPVILLAALLIWRIGVVINQNAMQAQQREARLKAPPVVNVATVRPGEVIHLFQATGSAQSSQDVKIAPKITGRVTYLTVQEGEHIRAGQVLVMIDRSALEAMVKEARANLTEAQHRLVQAELTQNPTNVSADTQLSQGKAAVASAQADYSEALKNYRAQIAAALANTRDVQSRVDAAKAAIASATASFSNATVTYDRTYTLYKQGFIAAQDVDNAKTTLKTAQATLQTANQQLKSADAEKQAAQEQYNITSTTAMAAISDARTKLSQAVSSLQFAKSNLAQKPAYVENIAALQATADSANQSLAAAQANLADTVITSPFDGFVTGRFVDPGAVVTPGQQVLDVQFTSTIWVNVGVTGEVSGSIRIGQTASATFSALPGRTYSGKILQFNPSADPTSRQFTVRVVLPNPKGVLKPGMFGRVSIVTERAESRTTVPPEALKTDAHGDYVIVVGPNRKAERRSVVKGPSDAGTVIIGQGVRPGETVIVLSAVPIRDGQQVKIGERAKRTPQVTEGYK